MVPQQEGEQRNAWSFAWDGRVVLKSVFVCS